MNNLKIEEAIAQLNKYDEAYYNGVSTISDDAYDAFKKSILDILPEDHVLRHKVGHMVSSSWPKKSHRMFMGSQNKVSDESSIIEWIENIYKKLNNKNIKFIVQYKIDGLSLGCYYKKGVIQDVLTRGDGFSGESIVNNAINFRELPYSLAVLKDINVRGEGYLSNKYFDVIQKRTQNKYKNARNAVSGICRRLDGDCSHFVDVFAFDINAEVKTETEKIETLKKLGFNVVPTSYCSTIDSILKIYRDTRDTTRKTLPYGIDGLVLKVDNLDFQKELGIEHNRPVAQIALKFDSEEETTTIEDIKLQVGRTGKIVPIAILTPVELMGSTVKKASLHNFRYIVENQIGIDAVVSIEKCGDIIPQVSDLVLAGKNYINPEVCPSCGKPIEDDGVNLWCKNKRCKEKEINRINYWMNVLDIKGFSNKFIEKLWDLGKINCAGDLYKLKPEDFEEVEGIGSKTIKNFFKVLEDTSEMYLETFIRALGISSCSVSTSAVLVQNFKDWDTIKTIKPEDLAKIPGYGISSATTICEDMREIFDMADELLSVIKIKQKKIGNLNNKSFCATGSFTNMSRKSFQDIVTENGGIVKNDVGKGLDYLVSNDSNSGSSKNEKAKKYGVKVISEKEFMALIGTSVEAKAEEKKEKDKKDSGVTLVYNNIFEED